MTLRTAGVLAVATLLACGGSGPPPGPVSGEVAVRLTTTHSQVGAVMFRVIGQVDEVTAIGSVRVSTAAAGPTATRIIVSGALTPGDVVRLRVPDVEQITAYVVVTEQVASRDGFVLLDPGGAQLTVRR